MEQNTRLRVSAVTKWTQISVRDNTFCDIIKGSFQEPCVAHLLRCGSSKRRRKGEEVWTFVTYAEFTDRIKMIITNQKMLEK